MNDRNTQNMKVKISSDEWYPVYELDDFHGKECEVPEETVNRWKHIREEFDLMQKEMRKANLAPAPGSSPCRAGG